MKSTELLAHPSPHDHLVQFCGEESALLRNVALYLKEGADQGDRMVVVATPSHRRLFTEHLEAAAVRVSDLVRDGRLRFLDAGETLASFSREGEPDWSLFDQNVGGLLRDLKSAAGGLRAYGEMVDLLWKEGRLNAAIRLEGYWIRLLESLPFTLYCAYTVDLLAPGTTAADMLKMVSTHSHLLPFDNHGALEEAVSRAMNEVLGSEKVNALLPLIRANVVSRVVLPEAERIVMWLKRNLPPYASDVLSLARGYYEQACARGTRP